MDVILASESTVVYMDGPNLDVGGLATATEGGRRTLATASAALHGMGISSGTIYYDAWEPSDPMAGTVERVSLTANEFLSADRLARGLRGPGSLAATGPTIFWATSDCEIQSTPTGD